MERCRTSVSVYEPAFYHTEQALATRVAAFVKKPVEVDLLRVRRWIDGYTQKLEITLSVQQRQAVELAASSRMLVLTGGPGCGKTFTTKTIVALWKAIGKSILLAAPTGRAAQRLSEMTGREAKTIHRLLAFDLLGCCLRETGVAFYQAKLNSAADR